MRPRLFSFELAWTDAAFDAIYPDGTALPCGIRQLQSARKFDEMLAEIPLEQSLGLRAALWIVALAPLFTIRRFGTIASVTYAERGLVLQRLLASSSYAVRQLALSLKAIATLIYVGSPAVRASMLVAFRPESPVAPALVALGTGPSTGPSDPPPRARGGDHAHAAE